MAIPDPVNIGTAPNSGNGDPNRTAFDKLNKRDDWLNTNKAPVDAPKLTTRLDLSAVNFSASWRDDGAGNLGWYVGAAGAADGSQVKVATLDKTSGAVTFASKVTMGGTSGVIGNLADFRLLTANGVGWRLGSTATGTTPGYMYLQATTDGFVSNFTNSLAADTSGNVGIKTTSPIAPLDVSGAIRCVGGSDPGTGSAVFSISSGSFQTVVAGAVLAFHTGNNSARTERLRIDISGNVLSGVDNANTLGGPSNRWSVVYAGSPTINTSDAREKTAVRPFSEAETAAAKDLISEIGIYQWLASIEEKGEGGARLHVGMTAQRAIEIMESHGLDPWRYGFICRDEITRKVMVTQIVIEQKTEPDPEFDLAIEIIDGVPKQVRKARQPKRVFEMKPVIGLDGETVMQTVTVVGESGFPLERQEPILHPVPVMVEVEREVEVDEPAGDRLGLRYSQLTQFMLRGIVSAATPA